MMIYQDHLSVFTGGAPTFVHLHSPALPQLVLHHQDGLAPQGVFGSLIGALAPTVGQAVGGLLGHPNAGQQIGTIGGHIANLLPFSAQPQVQLAPQGVFGSLLGSIAPSVGQAVGGLLGHPNAGQQISTIGGHIANLLPFSAMPQIIYR
jgi:hypothetical protein